MRKNTMSFAAGVLTGAVLFGGSVAYAAGVLAEPSWQNIYVDGKQVAMTAYNIGGSNYVKLRDIGQAVGFNVYWDNGVQIDSTAPYTGEAPAASAVPDSGGIQISSYKGNTIPVGERSGLIVGPGGPAYTVTSGNPAVAIDYRLNGEQDRYWLPLQIGAGRGTMLEQMGHLVESCLNDPDFTTRDFYTASPGLGELLHEHFGPQLQEDLEKLSGQVLGHFRQHCNITRLEQQFMLQAQALPEREQQRFQESAKTAIVKLRRAANTGQAIESLHAQTSPVHGDTRQSVRVKLHKIKAEQQEKSVLHKKRDDPQR